MIWKWYSNNIFQHTIYKKVILFCSSLPFKNVLKGIREKKCNLKDSLCRLRNKIEKEKRRKDHKWRVKIMEGTKEKSFS